MKKFFKLDKYEQELELHLEHCQKFDNKKTA